MRARGARLRVTGGIVAVAAAVPIGAVIFLPSFYSDGVPFSLWNKIPAAFTLEPLGVAILGLCAGIMMARGRVSGRRWLAAGILIAFGIQMLLYAWGTQFGIAPPQTAGSAGIPGLAGGLMLVAAGVLGAVGIGADRAGPDLADNQDVGDSPNTF
jgi:hypothetical protein